MSSNFLHRGVETEEFDEYYDTEERSNFLHRGVETATSFSCPMFCQSRLTFSIEGLKLGIGNEKKVKLPAV